VCRHPDTKYRDVDRRDNNERSPFNLLHRTSMFGYESNPVNDDLHEKLDLENPAQ
jgi:predicted HTH transcriptional regulator